MKKAATLIISLVVTGVLVWLVFSQLVGRPVSTDLSLVGQGKPALVLAHENYSPAGMAAMDIIHQVRRDYDDRVLFLVADLGAPAGKDFADRHNIPNGAAAYFSADGARLGLHGVATASAGALRQELDRYLR